MSSKYNNYLTDKEKDEIVRLYEEGLNTVEIGKKLNRNNSSIGRYLKRIGKPRFGFRSKLTIKDREDILRKYKSGMTSREIYEEYKDKTKCEETIQTIVRNNNISRSRGVKNIFNESYFEEIDTPNKAYYLGFWMADGNVHKSNIKKGQMLIQMSLKSEDKYILEKFKEEIKASVKVSDCNRKNKGTESRISVYSDKMARDLSKYGVIPNKTFLLKKLPCIDEKFIPDLIRGIFDGDGTVYINKKSQLRFGFYGTYDLVFDIIKHLNRTINIPLNKIAQKESISFITYASQKDIINFYKYIYNTDCLYLKRKKEKFEKYFRLKGIEI